MANHCDDVGCSVCGRIWCVRCGDRPKHPPTGGAAKNERLQGALKRGATRSSVTTCCGQPVVYV